MKDMQYSNFQLMLTFYPRRGVTYILLYYSVSSKTFSTPREGRRKAIVGFINSSYTEMYNSLVIRDKRKL